MEKNAWNPGIWKRWDTPCPNLHNKNYFLKYNYSSMPPGDWNNVGPLLSCSAEAGAFDGGTCRDTPTTSSEGQKLTFIMMKDVSRTFPLKKSVEYAYPLTNPRTTRSACRCIEKNNFLWHQGANKLDVFELKEKQYVVHPESIPGKRKCMIISEMIPRHFSYNLENRDKVFYRLKESKRLPLTYQDEICQVISKELNNRIFVLSQSKNSVEYYSLKEDLTVDGSVSIPHFKDKYVVTSTDLSDAVPGYYSTAVSSGIVSLYDISSSTANEPIWKNCFGDDNECVYQCNFDRQARFLIVNNKSSVWQCDTRTPGSYKSNRIKTLFDVSDWHSHLNPDDIVCKVVRSGSHHLYVVTSNCVLVMDERNCKLPTMKWDHMFTKHPSFATRCKIKNFEVLFLGNRFEFRLGAFYQDFGNKAFGYCVSGLPAYFNTMQDTVQFAHQQNFWFNTFADRIGNPLTGIASCINPSDDSSLILFTLNDTGDIFIQDFYVQSDETIPASNDWVTAYEKIGVEMLQDWEKQVVELSLQNLNEHGCTKRNINLNRFYKKVNTACVKNEPTVWSMENYVMNKFSGKKLDLNVRISSTGEGLAKFLPEEISNYIKPSYLKNCNDEISSSIMKLWEKEVETNNKTKVPSVKYSRFPCKISDLSTLPKKMKTQHNANDRSCDVDSSILGSPKMTDKTFSLTPVHSEKKNRKGQLKKRVDGF